MSSYSSYRRRSDEPPISESRKKSSKSNSRSEVTLQRARDLRQDLSIPEVVLWSRLRPRVLKSVKFRRQHPIGPYIVDFYCHAARFVVELDGYVHRNSVDRDSRRDRYLRNLGLTILRIDVSEFSKDPDAWTETIIDRAKRLIAAGRGSSSEAR